MFLDEYQEIPYKVAWKNLLGLRITFDFCAIYFIALVLDP